MSDTTAATTKTEVHQAELVEAEPTALAIPRDITPTLGGLSLLAQAEAQAKKLIAVAASLRTAALRGLIQPEDLILSKGRNDSESAATAMIGASGVTRIRAPYGLYVNPLPGATLEPQRIEMESKDGQMRRGWWLRFIGGSTLLNVEEEMEVYRWDHEPFLGRDDIPSDPKQATRTLALTKVARDLVGLKSIPVQELRQIGVDVSRCRRGTGFGTSQDRTAEGVTAADVKADGKKLGDEIMRRTGGVVDEANKLLKEITANPEKGFAGSTSIKQLTQGWQIERAWKALRAHPQYGDAATSAHAEGDPDAQLSA